eukprot:scpid99672/ scgid30508/ Transcription initiation factor TFIID subunit 10; Transcription initiation factor TFIID 30 kDa subunit
MSASSAGNQPASGSSSSGDAEKQSSSALLPDEMRVPGENLAEFVQQLEDYMPTIPDAVTGYYLNRAGFEASDARVVRLISLSAQKFVADILNDALQHHKIRGPSQSTKKSGKQQERKVTLTMEDLTPPLNERGIVIKKPPYFT